MAYISFQPSDYFNTQLYTGTGSTNAQTGVGFQPDWVFIQNRGGTYANVVFDVVRGTTKLLEPQGSGAEATVSDTLTSFDSDGFTLGADSSNYCNRSSSPNTYAAWNWRAGGGQGSSNTDGSINTTYTSVNTTSGFSISTYTGTGSAATIGHGLGATPDYIIVKNRSDSGESWMVWNNVLAANKYLLLNTTGAEATDTTIWNNTLPTSSVFSIGTHDTVNKSGSNYVAYCFTNIKGFSKVGSYTGNGGTDGPFVYTGFKPAWVMIKASSRSTDNWLILDNKRSTYNPANNGLFPNNASSAEGTGYKRDFLSNGFKVRESGANQNGSGHTFTYIAFAEEPLVSSNNIPATAR